MTIRVPYKFAHTWIAVAGLLAGLASAQPEPWLHPDGTIHYYDAVAQPAGITWFTAANFARYYGGYLATITSPAEDSVVFSLLDSDIYWYERPGSELLAGPWLGGCQPCGSHEPDSGWRWITGEPFSLSGWSPGQPDDQGGNENALHLGESVGVCVPTWDDVSASDDSIRGFVRELSADSTTLGLLHNDSGAFVGYTLFSPCLSRYTYLIDNKGRPVHSWRSFYLPALSACLLENGHLLRSACIGNQSFFAGGAGGRVEEFDWNGSLVWSYQYSDSQHCLHHDIRPLPNGNVLMIAWELKTRSEAIAAGRNPARLYQGKLWPDHIIEVNPADDSIAWEWHIWDHLIQDFDSTRANYGVVADHPELVDINALAGCDRWGSADWNHTNTVDYNPQFDQIMLSVRQLCEVLVIDHSTTAEEARGHSGGRQGVGGDILYRWGNPRNYRAGDSSDQKFFYQHDAQWIEPGLPGAGHVLVFNNGRDRPGGHYSTVDEFIPACDSTGTYPRPSPGSPFGPATQSWVYCADPPTSFYSPFLSSAQRLPSGSTLANLGQLGAVSEVTPDNQVVWRYVNPVTGCGPLHQGIVVDDSSNSLFRTIRYAPDYPGLAGRDLTPGYPLELYGSPLPGISSSGRMRLDDGIEVYPNPVCGRATIRLGMPRRASAELDIYSIGGRLIRTLKTTARDVVWDGTDNAGKPAGRGVYYCRLNPSGSSKPIKLVKVD